jgi:hypothetical protein
MVPSANSEAVMPKSGFEVNLGCYLWDLVDEGIDTALDRIKNETGVTGIVVPVHGPAVRQLRPHPGVLPKTFHSPGGAQFQPDPSYYAGTRIRPVVDSWLHKANHLKRVAEACHERGLTVGVRVLACQSGPVVTRYEHATMRDVFGDQLAWLCPVNPDVQEYVRGLLSDLTENYLLDFVRLGLVGFPWSCRGMLLGQGHESRGFPRGDLELWLRSLCFCPSCRQLSKRDGRDIDGIAGQVADTLEKSFRVGACLDADPQEFLNENPEIEPLLTWRRDQLHSWLASIRQVSRIPIALDHHHDWVHSGIDMQAAAAFYDQYVWTWDRAGAADIDAMICKGSVQEPSRLGMNVSAGEGCPDSASLVSAVAKIAKAGWRSVYVDNYGILPLDRLEWVREAVRYARRESV